jgi:hypothetical protein
MRSGKSESLDLFLQENIDLSSVLPPEKLRKSNHSNSKDTQHPSSKSKSISSCDVSSFDSISSDSSKKRNAKKLVIGSESTSLSVDSSYSQESSSNFSISSSFSVFSAESMSSYSTSSDNSLYSLPPSNSQAPIPVEDVSKDQKGTISKNSRSSTDHTHSNSIVSKEPEKKKSSSSSQKKSPEVTSTTSSITSSCGSQSTRSCCSRNTESNVKFQGTSDSTLKSKNRGDSPSKSRFTSKPFSVHSDVNMLPLTLPLTNCSNQSPKFQQSNSSDTTPRLFISESPQVLLTPNSQKGGYTPLPLTSLSLPHHHINSPGFTCSAYHTIDDKSIHLSQITGTSPSGLHSPARSLSLSSTGDLITFPFITSSPLVDNRSLSLNPSLNNQMNLSLPSSSSSSPHHKRISSGDGGIIPHNISTNAFPSGSALFPLGLASPSPSPDEYYKSCLTPPSSLIEPYQYFSPLHNSGVSINNNPITTSIYPQQHYQTPAAPPQMNIPLNYNLPPPPPPPPPPPNYGSMIPPSSHPASNISRYAPTNIPPPNLLNNNIPGPGGGGYPLYPIPSQAKNQPPIPYSYLPNYVTPGGGGYGPHIQYPQSNNPYPSSVNQNPSSISPYNSASATVYQAQLINNMNPGYFTTHQNPVSGLPPYLTQPQSKGSYPPSMQPSSSSSSSSSSSPSSSSSSSHHGIPRSDSPSKKDSSNKSKTSVDSFNYSLYENIRLHNIKLFCFDTKGCFYLQRQVGKKKNIFILYLFYFCLLLFCLFFFLFSFFFYKEIFIVGISRWTLFLYPLLMQSS